MPARHAALRRTALAILVFACQPACYLTIDPSDYPYRGEGLTAMPADAGLVVPADASSSAGPDTNAGAAPDGGGASEPGPKGPRLRLSELMIRVSPEEGQSGEELGEYLEIVNLGPGTADPRRVVIELVGGFERIEVDRVLHSDIEREVLRGLGPMAPGSHFVFVRQDSPGLAITAGLAPGTFYEYRRHGRDVGLSNQTRHLRLLYEQEDRQYALHDQVRWTGGYLDEGLGSDQGREIWRDVAFGVRAGMEDLAPGSVTNPGASRWCYHIERIPQSPLYGSPGQATPRDCL